MRWVRGFTLLEAMIGVAIIATACIGILSALSIETTALIGADRQYALSAAIDEQLSVIRATRAPLPPLLEGRSSSGQVIWRVEATDVERETPLPMATRLQEVRLTARWADPASSTFLSVRTRHLAVGADE